MKNNKQRIGAQELDFELVTLYKSKTNKSSTTALHFDTEETNQFCDFTEAVLEITSDSGIKHGSVTLFTPHTTTAVVINESETGYINPTPTTTNEQTVGGVNFNWTSPNLDAVPRWKITNGGAAFSLQETS